MFESIGIYSRLTLWSFFFKPKSNYIEKLNLEIRKILFKKGLIPWSLMRLSAVWYGVGYDIQSLNIQGASKFWYFLGDLCLAKLFFVYVAAKVHSNPHAFPRFNHSSIVTYVINNRWHHILSRRSNLVDSLQNIKFFWTARLTS